MFSTIQSFCRPSILPLDTCMYLGGVTRTQFLYVKAMDPLLGLIDFQTSREFTYGLSQCERLVHYEMMSWPTPQFISCYRIEVKVSTKSLVQLELTQAHQNPKHSNSCFSHFSLIRARNCEPFFFLNLENLRNLRIFLNFLNQFATSSSGSSGQLANDSESRALWLVLVIFPSSELGIVHQFFWIPHSSRNIMSKFENFCQSAQPVRQGYLRTALFFAFFAPFFQSVRALMLQMGL